MTITYVSDPVHPDVLAELANSAVHLGYGPTAVPYDSSRRTSSTL